MNVFFPCKSVMGSVRSLDDSRLIKQILECKVLLDGAIAYKLYGLQLTPRIIEATKQYFLTEDTIGTFFRECIIEDNEGQVPMMELYNAYKLYCDQNLVEAKNKDVFSKSELLKKYPSRRSGKLGRYKVGLRLKDEYRNV